MLHENGLTLTYDNVNTNCQSDQKPLSCIPEMGELYGMQTVPQQSSLKKRTESRPKYANFLTASFMYREKLCPL